MAKPNDVYLINQGVEVWNSWRRQLRQRHEQVQPDLSGIDLGGKSQWCGLSHYQLGRRKNGRRQSATRAVQWLSP